MIWGRRLIGAILCLNSLVCGMATLFDPSHVLVLHSEVVLFDENDVENAAFVAAHAQEFNRVLQPLNPLYAIIHERRHSIGLLASKVSDFLFKCEGEHSDCIREVYNLYKTLVSDVGKCHAHRNEAEPRKDYERWISPFLTQGLALSHSPILGLVFMDCYHAELQNFGTGYRHMSDLDKQILQDLIEGCSSLFPDVRSAAQSLLTCSVQMLAGSAKFFLPLMLTKTRRLIESKEYRRIEGALESLVSELQTWERHCASYIPDLQSILIETAAMDVSEVPKMAFKGKQGITEMATPGFRGQTTFLKDGIAETIRPAGDYSDPARMVHTFIQSKDNVLEQKNKIGIDVIKHTKDPLLCVLAIRILIRPNFDPPPYELISFLAVNAVAANRDVQMNCVQLLGDTIEDFLLGIRFEHNLEDYIRTQGSGGTDHVQVTPSKGAAYTERYLAGFRMPLGGADRGSDDDDAFVDPTFLGSLVWPTQFSARRRDAKPLNKNPEIARVLEHIGSFFTKEWFEEFLSVLKLGEEPWEGDEDSEMPGIWTANLLLLTQVFQLMEVEATPAKLEDVTQLVETALEDRSKIGHHIAAATLLLSLLRSPRTRTFRSRVLKTAEPILIDIFEHKMSFAGETWAIFLRRLTKNRDPRRNPWLPRHVLSIRLDPSDETPKSNAKLDMIKALLASQGWRFRDDKVITSMLLQAAKDDLCNVEVSSSVGTTLALLFNSRFYNSWPDVRTLIAANNERASLGIRLYEPVLELQNTVRQMFKKISLLRAQEPIPYHKYHSAATMALAFVSGMLRANASAALVHILNLILEELFRMLDAKLPEETELKDLAISVLENLCRLPFRGDEATALRMTIENKAGSEQLIYRTTSIGMLCELYLQRLCISTPEEQRATLKAVSGKIEDAHSKTQLKAAEVLRNLLSRSCLSVTKPIVEDLVENSIRILQSPEQTAKFHLVAIHRLSATVSAYPQLIDCPKWMVTALKSLASVAQLDRAPSTKVASNAIRDFIAIRRMKWDIVKKVGKYFLFFD